MADRIVVMNHGVIEQVGAPSEIYGAPRTPFVADFVGHMTFLDGVLAGPRRVRVGGIEFTVAEDAQGSVGAPVRLALRPETARLQGLDDATPNRFEARIGELAFLGSFCRARLEPTGSSGLVISADVPANAMRDLGLAEGDVRPVAFPPDSLRVFPGAPS